MLFPNAQTPAGQIITDYIETTKTLRSMHAFISSHLDYCNSLLYGINDKLQAVQNAAAHSAVGYVIKMVPVGF